MPKINIRRTQYQGLISLTYHLKYGKGQWNVTMLWISTRKGYSIESADECKGNCNNPEFPYRVSQRDLQRIEELSLLKNEIDGD